MNGGGIVGALVFVIGVLLGFAVLFGLFLVVPFFIFLAGVILMLIADRRRATAGKSAAGSSGTVESGETKAGEARS